MALSRFQPSFLLDIIWWQRVEVYFRDALHFISIILGHSYFLLILELLLGGENGSDVI